MVILERLPTGPTGLALSVVYLQISILSAIIGNFIICNHATNPRKFAAVLLWFAVMGENRNIWLHFTSGEKNLKIPDQKNS